MTLALAGALLVMGCGDKKADAPKAGKQEPAAKSAKAAKAAPKPAAPKPKPPTLSLDKDKLLHARIVERCALRHGESERDARVVAIDDLAGRPYQAAAPAAAGEKGPAADKGAAAKPAAKPAAKKPAKPAKPEAAKPAAAKADPATDTPAAKPESPADERTPGGRMGLDPKEDAKRVASYEADVKLAEAWAPYKKAMDDAVAACHWAPEIGYIDAALVDRYASAFVAVTCLQDKHRSKDGQVDEVAHARAAVEVFRKYDFDAPGFARLGVVMARFPKIQAAIHQARSKACPDPRVKAAAKAAEGPYIGELSGQLRGHFAVKASAGKVTGTLTLTSKKGGKKGGKKGDERTMAVEGTVFGERVHMNANDGQDWLRLDCGGGKAKGASCRYAGSVGFKKRKGGFTFRRPPAPKPEDSPSAVSPDAAVPAKAAPAGKGVPLPIEERPKAAAPTPPKGTAPVVPAAPIPAQPAAGKPEAR